MKKLTGIALAASMLMTSVALADWKPDGPVKIQIGFGAGGTTDIVTRVVADAIKRQTGWNVIAENKPGGGGIAMLAGISKSKPDGKLVGVSVNMPLLMQLAIKGEDKMPVNIESLDYIGTLSNVNLAWVADAKAPYNNMRELVKYAQTNDVKVGFDAPPQKIILAAIKKKHGAKFNMVPFKSSGDMVPALLGGHIDVMSGTGLHVEHVKSGKMKVITIVGGDVPDYAPNAKTLKQEGYPYAVNAIFFMAAPKGLPAHIKEKWEQVLDNAIGDAKVQKVIFNTLKNKANNIGAENFKNGLKTLLVDIKQMIKDK